MPGTYTIKDLENLSGIKAHTIRIWEKRYGLLIPQRTDTNIRRYTDDDLKKIINISLLVNRGFKISKIAALSEEELYNHALKANSKPEDTNDRIEKLIFHMLSLDVNSIEQEVESLIQEAGVEKAIYQYIFPLMEKIGALWQANSIVPAQEHFMFNFLRQKLIVETDKLPKTNGQTEPSGLFFLPEGENHEFSLLFYNYLARKNGHHTLYLGQSVPLSDILTIAESFHFDYYFTAIITSTPKSDFEQFLGDFSHKVSTSTLFVTGKEAQHYKRKHPRNTRIISRPEKFSEEIRSLTRKEN
ncbi:MerR family transcriptional regulator [Prolixibacter denitrificans]|uniref:DNA-binding transcriptional MerR regulator n=1 Tax=Prolixibacter denitrificans TaxID=1541063 RepID=A0A2P8CAK0_9BACT|nr:MerR family transcriptional regulator [Prolixibacter denitrificans]PSK82001.1 DNA-binding transcriptional MerR regulator [Prolixibacter denitrificans]GET22598.1 MerR family transcriptional regulator [Prolixibacter denitrificans]